MLQSLLLAHFKDEETGSESSHGQQVAELISLLWNV